MKPKEKDKKEQDGNCAWGLWACVFIVLSIGILLACTYCEAPILLFAIMASASILLGCCMMICVTVMCVSSHRHKTYIFSQNGCGNLDNKIICRALSTNASVICPLSCCECEEKNQKSTDDV